MGGSSSQVSSDKLYDAKEYDLIQQITDQRYGPIKILRHNNTGFLACEIDKTINSQDSFETILHHSAGRKQISHESLVQLINYTFEKNEEFCSKFWKISQLYEYVNQDLREQIQVRSTSGLRYREGELWYMLIAIINGLVYLKEREICHGDIRPSQILFTREGRVKLGENFQEVKTLTAYQQLYMQVRNDQFYISPEVFATLRDRNVSTEFDAAACDVFSLGMTILEAATLQNGDLCYHPEQDYTFDSARLRALLDDVQQNYSQKFYDVLCQLLIERDEERPKLEDVKADIDQLVEEEYFRRDINENVILYEIQVQTPTKEEQEQEVLEQQQVVQQPEEQQGEEEQVKRAVHVEQQPVSSQQQPAPEQVQTVTYENNDIDQRISHVLAMSRETVRKYGGEKAYQAYEAYEQSKGYEPVHHSLIGQPEYTSAIYQSRIPQDVQQTTQVVTRVEQTPVVERIVQRVEEPVEEVVKHATRTVVQEPVTTTTTRVVQEPVTTTTRVVQEPVVTRTYVQEPVTTTTTRVVGEPITTSTYVPEKTTTVSGTYTIPAQQTSVSGTYQPTTTTTYVRQGENYETVKRSGIKSSGINQSTTYVTYKAPETTTTTIRASGNYVPYTTTTAPVGEYTTTTTYTQPQVSSTVTRVSGAQVAGETTTVAKDISYVPVTTQEVTTVEQIAKKVSDNTVEEITTTVQQNNGNTITNEELDQKIKDSLQRSKEIDEIIKSTQKVIGTEAVQDQPRE